MKTEKSLYGLNDLMVTAAFRYCLGRQTYIVGECADWLIEIWPALKENAKVIIQRELEQSIIDDDEARRSGSSWRPLGGECDRKDWARVRKLWQ